MKSDTTVRLEVIDSHTEGEPTRVILGGAPDLGRGPVAQQLLSLRDRYDWLRTSTVLEPRGSDAVVGALRCESAGPSCVAGVIFFNNTGYLGMCGHGTIGLAVTLAHRGHLRPGRHRFETPVGLVSVELLDRHRARFENVPSYRHLKGVEVGVEGLGTVHGDVAWGGNWFFLVGDHREDLRLQHRERLTDVARRIREALRREGITGRDGADIDHVELFGPPLSKGADARNFVLCPGGAYDRSPCGTGTSAKLACLAADGELAEGTLWRQESIVGTLFEASYRWGEEGAILPSIGGSAHVTAETTLILDPADPFRHGIAADGAR